MSFFTLSFMFALLMAFSTSGLTLAQDYEEPFMEEQQRAEFKEMETKGQMNKLYPPAVVQPGPEAPPGVAAQLLRDRLEVLEANRANAVQQRKPAEEIARIDAQIKDIKEQLAAYR